MNPKCQLNVSLQLFFTSLSFFFLPFHAFSQTPFYEGKTINVLAGTAAGGSGDMRLRAAIPFLQKYIPGNPAIVVEYMPGGGGRKAANFVYRTVRPDGLTIGSMSSGLVPAAVLGETGVLYDLDKLIYLGSANTGVISVFLTRREVGLDTVDKLRSAPGLRIGAQSVGHIIYTEGRFFTYLLGLKEPRFVTGYSGPEVDLALSRGEVDARVSYVDTIPLRAPEWIEKGLVDFHAVIEIPKRPYPHPRFASLPDLGKFARSERERGLVAMARSFKQIAELYVLPPKTPKEHVEILREAMRKTFGDPEFRKEFKKRTGGDPVSMMPEAQEKAIRDLPRDPEIIDLYKKLAGAGAIPSR